MCASDLRAQVRRGRVATRLLVALTLASTAWGALAQSGTDRDREQIRRLREQVRQQQQAQAEMQASQQAAQAELSRQKAAAEAVTSAVRAQQGALQRRLQALQDEAAALRTERVRLQEETARLQAALAQSEASLVRTRDGASAAEQRAQQQFAAQGRSLAQCRRDNADLAVLGEELLARYERKGLAQMLAENEPFIQSGRVQLENARAAYAEQIARARQRPEANPAAR